MNDFEAKTRIICYVLIKNGEEILLLRRKSDDPDNPGLWELPRGAVEFGGARLPETAQA